MWLNVRDKGKGLLNSQRGKDERTSSSFLKFQKFLTFPTNGNWSYKYKKKTNYHY